MATNIRRSRSCEHYVLARWTGEHFSHHCLQQSSGKNHGHPFGSARYTGVVWCRKWFFAKLLWFFVVLGTKIGLASECFAYWKEPHSNDTWGLNFTSPIDAKQFKECCVSTSMRRTHTWVEIRSQFVFI